MKRPLAFLLIFSAVILSGNLHAEKKGVDLILKKKNGQQVRGELIAVKKDSLLLLDREQGADVTVMIEDINSIKIEKKSKALLGAGLGLIVGSSTILILAYANDSVRASFGEAVIHSLLWSIPVAFLGGGVGALLSKDKKIQIEGKSDSEIQEILEDLSKKASVPDFK